MSIEEYHNTNGITEYSLIEFEETEDFDNGQLSAMDGKQKTSCPYKSGQKKNSWVGGWETACLDGEFGINKIDIE